MKKILCVLLSVCLLVGCLPLSAGATVTASGTCGENLTWSFENGTLTISGTGDMADYNQGNQFPWKGQFQDSIQRIIIDNGVTYIDRDAFSMCKNLVTVDISSQANIEFGPDSEIWSLPFCGCRKLKEIRVDSENPYFTSVDGVLYDKEIKTLLEVPEGKQGELRVPEGVTKIADNAFDQHRAGYKPDFVYILNKIYIPSTVTSLPCTGKLTDGSWPIRAGEIEVSRDNPNFCTENGLLLSKNKTILFQCSNAKAGKVVIPRTVEKIAHYAFEFCFDVTELDVPRSAVFYNWQDKPADFENLTFFSSMNGIDFEEGNQQFASIDGNVYTPDKTCLLLYLDKKSKEFIIPEAVKRIGLHAFSSIPNFSYALSDVYYHGTEEEFRNLFEKQNYVDSGLDILTNNSIEIHYNSVGPSPTPSPSVTPSPPTTISGTYGDNINWTLENGTLTISGTGPMEQDLINGWPWHKYADSIEKVVIENGVTSLGDGAFAGCKNLTSVDLGTTVKSLRGGVFCECPSLTSLYIPASVQDIELGFDGAFYISYEGDTKFESISVAKDNSTYSSFDGALYSKDYTELLAVPEAKRELLISERTKKVTTHNKESEEVFGASDVFYNCSQLEKIEVEKGNSHLFSYNGVLYSIDEKALIFCPAKKQGQVSIPDGIEVLRVGCFSRSKYITEIFIPKSLRSFDNYEINQTVYRFDNDTTTPMTIRMEYQQVFPQTSLEGSAENQPQLKAIYVDEQNSNLCDVDGVLFNKSVTEMLIYPTNRQCDTFFIPESVTKIKNYAFQGGPFYRLPNLKHLVIPASVQDVFVGSVPPLAGDERPYINADIYGEEGTMAEKIADFLRLPFHTDRPSKSTYPSRPTPPPTPSMDSLISGTTPSTKPTTTTTTDEDGTITTTTTWPDGKTAVTIKKPDGDVGVKVTSPEGEGMAQIAIPSQPGPAKKFDDVTGGWYKDSVDKASALNLFSGTTDKEFSPNQTMTRAMLVTVLHRLSGKAAYGVGTGNFPDVQPGWYKDAVDWGQKTGLVTGTGAGFNPNSPITRQDLACVLYRYAQFLGQNTENSADIARFPDAGNVADYAQEAISWAVAEKFIQGRGNEGIVPRGNATRAEVAAILIRFIDYLKK